MDIQDKQVLITGGALRIGREICRMFAENQARVVIHFNRSATAAEELLTEIGGSCSGNSLIQKDFSNLKSVEDLIPSIGKTDILINNASTYLVGEETPETAQEQLRINYEAPKLLMKQFRDQQLETGCIINLLDQKIGHHDAIGGSYLESKQKLAKATIQTALDWAPKIRVNGIAPGPVIPPVGHEGPGFTKELDDVPLQRPVAMSDLVNACRFLVENESVTGQILYLDCGQHLSGGNPGGNF